MRENDMLQPPTSRLFSASQRLAARASGVAAISRNRPGLSPGEGTERRAAAARRNSGRRAVGLLLLAGVAMSAADRAEGARAPETARAQDAPRAQETVEFRSGLGIGGVTRSGRTVLRSDPVEAAIVAGTFALPAAGDSAGSSQWAALQANADGWFEGPSIARGGYVLVTHDAAEDDVLLLRAEGHSGVYVNGEPRAGDPYASGMVRTAVEIRKGRNTFLFGAGRGRVRAKLEKPPGAVFVEPFDATLPDLEERSTGVLHAAALVTNATNGWRTVTIEASANGPDKKSLRREVELAPLMTRKVPLQLPGAAAFAPSAGVVVRVIDAEAAPGSAPPEASFSLRRRSADQTFVRTFVSAVDASVQYYAVVPPSSAGAHGDGDAPGRPALVVSLHGASVEATSQADAHAPKSWAVTVCPTNRRPFGFDWEDWGRWDALEVMAHASAEWRTDPTRVYLTGHSMGGHGTWNLSATHPGRFAALAPSAGWCSFWTYSAGPRAEATTEPGRLLRDAANGSDTTLLTENLLDAGIFILHGDADDNVPVREAREMRERLRKLGVEPGYHEQPGAGHWWDGPRAGADCLEWPGIIETFSQRRLPPIAETARVRFTTVNPGESARRAWVTIEHQERPLEVSKVDLTADAGERTIAGTAANIARLRLSTEALRLPHDGAEVKITIDGAALSVSACKPKDAIILRRTGEAWSASVAQGPDPAANDAREKGPGQNGLFKSAFDRAFLMVVGTGGTPEENVWALNKARLDAETWRIRGNGGAEIVTDARLAGGVNHTGRNVILYGHEQMNSAWASVLRGAPVSVRRGSASVGERTLESDHSAVLMVYPKTGDASCMVGVIAGTGLAGLRLCDRMPVFVSGVGIPDLLIADATLLNGGESGLVCAGFFGNDWSIEKGRWAFRGVAPAGEQTEADAKK